jgi:uncharacterized protein YndB with AHSA1/START domain
MSTKPIIKEVTINASAEKVWNAITDKDEMKLWYFNLEEFKPEVGFEFSFEGGNEDRVYIHLCKITEVIPGKKLTYSWQYKNYPGISYVTFEIFPEDDSTLLRLTHTGIESFQTDNPDFARESFTKGWEYIIGTSLKEFLEKRIKKTIT